jgi:hypothetical protein
VTFTKVLLTKPKLPQTKDKETFYRDFLKPRGLPQEKRKTHYTKVFSTNKKTQYPSYLSKKNHQGFLNKGER